ncbi:MAG: AAA family ATPase [Candidatus Hydrothermia bacterium]|jgi:transitional endoplasmic reticulum ATPase
MEEKKYFVTIATSDTIENVFQYKIFADNNEYLKRVRKGDKLVLIVREGKDFRIMGVYEAEGEGYFDDKNAIFGDYNNDKDDKVKKVKFPYRVKFRETDIKFDVDLSLIQSKYPQIAFKIKDYYYNPGKRIISGKEFYEIVNACLFKPDSEIKFDDIAGLDNLKNYIRRKISFKNSPMNWEKWKEWKVLVEKLNHNPKYGILLFGPPGTGKTMFSKALANEIGGKYFEIKAHHISGYPGEGEKRIESIFEELLSSERAVLFIDEAEWILRRREEQTSSVMQRITPTLLSQWSRVFEYESNKNLIFVIMTTNQPEMIDPAFLRPGRFDSVFYVPPPNKEQVKQILEKQLKNYWDEKQNIGFDEYIDDLLGRLSTHIYGENNSEAYYCGADIYQLCKVAKEIAIHNESGEIRKGDIEEAKEKIKPSIRREVIEEMEKFMNLLKAAKA